MSVKINGTMTLADVVKEYPQTIPYLNELHLDYCCDGHSPISTTVRENNLDEAELLGKLNELAEKAPQNKNSAEDIERFEKLSVNEMLDDLEETHHVTDRRLMKDAEDSLNKILIAHYPHHGEMLTELHHKFALLKADLEEHFAKEERYTFPIMRANPEPDAEQVQLVKDLEDEHTAAGDVIKEIQELTENFTLPADACPTFAHTYAVLQDLFNDIFIHIFKENSVTFPEYYEKASNAGACSVR
ncbi:DUF542 domain-containing protein [Eubacterium sp. F2]|uniref:DUF542 domain-containing protein n=1 Tax=Eubacterium sp. F2 TaxID=3381348 RepID=UPI0039083259